VSMAGVQVGRVARIDLDPKDFKAVVDMHINAKYNQIPVDSDASIYTEGLLGGKYVGLTAGGSDTFLKDHGQLDFTQSALVIENLIGQMLANFAKGAGGSGGSEQAGKQGGSAPEKTK